MTAVLPDIELFLLTEFTEEIACEHSDHRKDSKHHAGAAKWLQIDIAQVCACPMTTLYVCDKWKKHVEPGIQLYCSSCKTALPADWREFIKYVPINPEETP